MLNITNHQGDANQNIILVQLGYHQKDKNNKCWQRCRERRTVIHCWWEFKLVQPLGKNYLEISQKLKIELPVIPLRVYVQGK